MSSNSYTEDLKNAVRNTKNGFLKFLDDHDSASWPSFLVFMAVITVGLFFNVEAFAPIVGNAASIAIAVFFEYAIVAWKATCSRKRNSAKQNQIAQISLWLSVFLAIAMLIVNIFRIGGEIGFENIAYVIVGVAAFVQVVGYLLFDGANPDKTMDREHSQNEREVLRKERHADQKIAELKSDARIIERVGDELQKVIEQYGHLPSELLEPLVEAARAEMLKGFKVSPRVEQETRKMADVNKDGKIGGMGARKAMDRGMTNVLRKTGLISEDQVYETKKVDLEAMKELPIETLFEDEPLAPLDANQANEVPNEEKEGTEPDF